MSIRRQYSLPNCTLVLEGFSNNPNPIDGRPLLDIVVNAECHFVGVNQKLQGGRVFLENLVKTVSEYAQECLSGIRHPQAIKGESEDHIDLTRIGDTDLHRLTWQPPAEFNQPPVELKLTTVQLFDLVEAIDQFFADSATLPDLSLKLQPISRRYRQPDEPLSRRVVPPMIGVASIVIAAIAVFMIPIPAVRKPDPNPKPQPSPTQTIPIATPSAPPTPRK